MINILASSEEQASGVGQIRISVQQLVKISQQNAPSSEELVSTAEEMRFSSTQLQRLVGYFKME